MKIAVLEDNPSILEYMTTVLEMAGHHVDVHTQGASLFDALFRAGSVRTPLPYDLITVDLLLPGGLSGVEVITRIRHAIPAEQLPIIVISGAGQAVLEQVHMRFPHMPILQKPFKRHALLDLLETLKRSKNDADQLSV